MDEREQINLDEAEEHLTTLQNNINHIERKIRLTDSEKKADVENCSLDIKKNDLIIKQLTLEVKELEVRIEKSQKADEAIIMKEFQPHSKELGRLKGKSAKEAVSLIDAQVLELDRKCKDFAHELQLLKRTYLNSEQQLKEMVTKCDEDWENEPTECDSLERIRELENDQQNVNQSIIECELAQNRFKAMKEQLELNKLSYPVLIQKVEKEYSSMRVNQNSPQKGDIQSKTSVENPVRSEAGDGIFVKIKQNNNLDASKIKKESSPQKEMNTSEISEQQTELNQIQDQFEQIKEVICVSNIQEAERKILTQKLMHEDLLDLKKRLTKSLQELKSQKKQLDCRMALIREVNAEQPKRELSDAIALSKIRHAEQEKRKNDAKYELDKLSSLLAEIEKREMRILQVLENYFPEAGFANEDMPLSEKIRKIEAILNENF